MYKNSDPFTPGSLCIQPGGFLGSGQPAGHVEFITPEIAADMLRYNTCNRAANNAQVARYATAIRNGQWQLNGESIIISKDGRLLNGQHRLLAVLAAGQGIETFVVRGVDVATFVTIDSGKARTDRDVFNIMGVPSSGIVSAAIGCYMKLRVHHTAVSPNWNGSSGLMQTRIDRQDFFRQHKDLVLQSTHEAARLYRKGRLLKTSVIAGLTLYLQVELGYPHDVISNFFSGVCDTASVPSCKAIALLRERLVKDMCGASRLRSAVAQKLIIKAWNAYISGKNMLCLRYSESNEGDRNIWFISPAHSGD